MSKLPHLLVELNALRRAEFARYAKHQAAMNKLMKFILVITTEVFFFIFMSGFLSSNSLLLALLMLVEVVMAIVAAIYIAYQDTTPPSMWSHRTKDITATEQFLRERIAIPYLQTKFDLASRLSPGTIPSTVYLAAQFFTTDNMYDGQRASRRDARFAVTSEDEIRVTKDGTTSRICEITIYAKHSRTTKQGDTVRTEYYWSKRGNYITLQQPVDHDFDGTTFVYSKSFPIKMSRGMENVRLESQEFSKQFRVYTDNQREARVCLKTNVMTALMDTLDSNNGIALEFTGGYVTIILETKHLLFELDLAREYSAEDLDKNVTLINFLTNITQQLNINHEYLYKTPSTE